MQAKLTTTIQLFSRWLSGWKQDYHPIELDTPKKTQQRWDYLHENPVRSVLVWEPWHYKYSSAINYDANEHGLIEIESRKHSG